MCGICGIILSNNDSPDFIRRMNASIAHRGPDAEGLWQNGDVALGHRRLSIIDLSLLGNQPMWSADGKVLLVFNGEIYNFRELKHWLQSRGYAFRSTSDTEVVLAAWQEWGTACFEKFNGMFALALYDTEKNQVVLARDHAGIKPLYYHLCDERLLFSSEIRGFKAFDPNWPANQSWPVYFLSFGFVPFPHSTLKDVYMLSKGSYLSLQILPSGEIGHSEIFSFHSFFFSEQVSNESTALRHVRETMLSAVERHMIADAPLGIFLSGGIDSSLSALIADHLGHQDLNTLSVTFNEATFNEEPFQDIVLKRMRKHHHQAYKVDEKMFIDHLDDIFLAMDQPSWDGVNSYFISKCAHEAGLKTVLSGLGGDELFGGYPSFQRIGMLNKLKNVPSIIRSFARFAPNDAMARLAFLNAHTPYNEYLFLRGAFTPDVMAQITGISEKDIFNVLGTMNLPDYPAERTGNLAAYLETNVYMENQLLKDTDYMSMWHSLEVRVPFLDKELMELMHRIDPSVKFNFSQPKYLLTKAFEDLLPREIVFRKKQGFTFPFNVWLKNHMDHFRPLLPDTPVTNQLVKKFMEGKVHWSRIWALMVWKKFSE